MMTGGRSAEVCTLDVSGMDCASCADRVERALRSLPGVQAVSVDVMGGKVRVEHAPESVGRDEMAGAITRAGYRVRDPDLRPDPHATSGAPRERKREAGSWRERRGRLVLAIASGVLWAASLAAEHLAGEESLAIVLAVGAIVAGGWYIVPQGVRAALDRALDMNFLMSLAAGGALVIGEYEEAASAIFLFAVAQLLESRSMDRARHAVRALMEVSPAEANVLRDGGEVRVPVERIAIGETVVVRPGEKIPADGLVTAGRSGVDQAAITGESLPVEKEPGAEVFAGTMNGEGALELRATRLASDTTLARIIHSVEEAQASRAPSQTFVDRFARVYTPAVVAGAGLVFLLPPLLGAGAWGDWFYRALVLLVVACPCALVISTPVTVVSALAGAARRGILIKGGLHLENAGRVRAVVFDKTGTLTRGRPAVVEVVAAKGSDRGEVLTVAAAVEHRSEHPIARAILRRAEVEELPRTPATEMRAIPGRGVQAEFGGDSVQVGSARFFQELGFELGEIGPELERFSSLGRTAVLVGRGSASDGSRPQLLGVIAVADEVRPGAARALRDLRRTGIRNLIMLTGDNPGAARAVANELQLDEFRAGLLPAEKVSFVRDLQRQYGRVLMVGDGVNDAPALAAADVGVAMGSAGTDVALETADIALMSDDLTRLATAIHIARRAERIIRVNIAFALLSKAAFVVLAVLGLATLWMAVLADMGASLLVILNGLRALRAPARAVARPG